MYRRAENLCRLGVLLLLASCNIFSLLHLRGFSVRSCFWCSFKPFPSSVGYFLSFWLLAGVSILKVLCVVIYSVLICRLTSYSNSYITRSTSCWLWDNDTVCSYMLGFCVSVCKLWSSCWFFFDGQVSNDVLGFIVPKLIIIGVRSLLYYDVLGWNWIFYSRLSSQCW